MANSTIFGNADPKGMSLGKVAGYCGVTRKTILRWVNDGLLSSFVLPSGHHRISPAEVARFLKKHKMPVPPEFESIDDSKTVLICDDDRQIRHLIRSFLMSDFIIEEAANGIECCLKLGALKPNLLLLDIKMPRMDGIEVCRQIRSQPEFSDLKIIIVSAYLEEEIEEQVRPMVDMMFSKPFSAVSLAQACLKLAEERTAAAI